MASKWLEVIKVTFVGVRFQDRALDVDALAELSQFQRIVAETAKDLWRANNPNRQRLPRHFEDRTRLCLRRIEQGSAVAPLEVCVQDPEQPELWDKEPAEIKEAIDIAYETFAASAKQSPLPDRLPKHLVSEYAKLGQALRKGEAMELAPPHKKSLRVTHDNLESLSKFVEAPYHDTVTICGEVLAADVRQMQFRIWINDQACVCAPFIEDQEETVTTALKEHKSVRVKVNGTGEFSADGVLQRIAILDSLDIVPPPQMTFDFGAPPIEEILTQIGQEVPESEWAKLPDDLTSNLDHYIYGTPKK
jgi:hypothetical protein